MKVMYEASVLGIAHSIKQKAGVFRVVETLAENLNRRDDVELTFYSDTNLIAAGHTLEYLKSKSDLEVPFSKGPLIKWGTKSFKVMDDYFKNKNGNKNSIIERLALKKAQVYNKILHRIGIPILKIEDLQEADIVHSPFYAFSDLIAKSKAKKFLTSYDLIPILFPEYVSEGNIRAITTLVNSITPETWVLSISESTKNDLLNYRNDINPDRVIVTELAASDYFYQNNDPADLHKVQQKYGIPQQQYILSLCTLEPRKNIDHLIKAFYQLIKQEGINDLSLVLVGVKGWNFDSIFNQISADPLLQSKVIVTGFVPDEDLAAIYSNALCFAYPTFYEGFGLPPLEAMQCGTPVITSNTSSIPEVVGDAGIMLSPKDLDGLSNAIYQIYSSDTYRNELVEKSLKRATHFSWSRCTNETVAAYQKSLQS